MVEETTFDARGLPRPRTKIAWDQLDALLSGDASVVMERYDWGSGEWRHNEFVEYLRRIVAGAGLRSRTERVATTFTGPPPAPFDVDAVPTHVRQTVLPIVSGFLGAAPGSGFAELGIAAVPVPKTRGGPIDSIVITNHSVGTATAGVDLGSGWMLTSSTSPTATGALQLVIAPGRAITVESAAPDIEARFGVESPAQEWVVLGSADASTRRRRRGGTGGRAHQLASRPDDLAGDQIHACG